MGQAAAQAGQAGVAGQSNEDAFRHFRDSNGTFREGAGLNHNDNYRTQGLNSNFQTHSANHQPPSNSNYNNNHDNYQLQNFNNNNAMSSPGAMVTKAATAVAGSCLYTDVTRPNGPMAREPPMEDSRNYGHHGNSNFSTHMDNAHNQQTPFVNVPPPAPMKAEAGTMMSTAFLQRNCPHMEPHKEDGGVVQFKIDTVNEECQVSESYNTDRRDDHHADRQASRRDDHRQDDRHNEDRHHDDRRNDDRRNEDRRNDDRRNDDRRDDDRRHDDRRTDDYRHDDRRHDDRRHDDHRHEDRHDDRRRDDHHDDRRHDDRRRDDRHDDRRRDDHHDDRRHDDNRQSQDAGMSTYDQVRLGMVTCDEPIQAPALYQQSPPEPPPKQSCPTTESQYSGFTALTSVSQQQPCPSMAPSNVGTSVAPAAASLTVAQELKMRETWAVASVIEVFSSSAAKWYIAQVVQMGEASNAHMFTVQFVGDNGQILQKSMPRSDMQLAVFGRNTRQMPPNFTKVASQSRPGQFSYQDSASGQKYETKELAWQNYYQAILKSEQAQNLLRQAALPQAQMGPQPQAFQVSPLQVPAMGAGERLAAERLMPAALQPAPTMASLAPAPAPLKKVSSFGSAITDLYGHTPEPKMARSFTSQVNSEMPQAHTVQHVVTPDDRQASTPSEPQKPQTMGNLPRSGKPFPGYGQSFAVGTNAGYEAYLASQGMA